MARFVFAVIITHRACLVSVFIGMNGMKITVAIATTGRPQIIGTAIRDLARQQRLPDRLIISAASQADVDPRDIAASVVAPEIVFGPRGATTQRNAALARLTDEDVILFLDDDFVMASDFLLRLEGLFRDRPDLSVLTGRVLADGIGNSGIAHQDALQMLAAHEGAGDPGPGALRTVNNAYGCNMAFRCAPIRAHGLRFDENLPLYSWLEDIDFSRRVAAHGRCLQASALTGVHLGTKSGRSSGLQFGYSQVANPVYLFRRDTMRGGHALRMISRNFAANLAKSLRPEPWVDRRGRLRGNLLALADLLRGRLEPRNILTLAGPADARS